MGTLDKLIPKAERIPEAARFKIAPKPKAATQTKPVDITQAPATAVVVPTKVARLNKVMNCIDTGKMKLRKLALDKNIIILVTMARSWSPMLTTAKPFIENPGQYTGRHYYKDYVDSYKIYVSEEGEGKEYHHAYE
jgi:hypothetical protein